MEQGFLVSAVFSDVFFSLKVKNKDYLGRVILLIIASLFSQFGIRIQVMIRTNQFEKCQKTCNDSSHNILGSSHRYKSSTTRRK
jgi:hypothetical protein